MAWSDVIEDRRGGRDGTVRLLLRLLGIGVLGYALVQTGAFAGPQWVATGTAAALLLSMALVILHYRRPFSRPVLVLLTALMLLGVLLNPEIDFLGTVFFVIGGIMLMGQPEAPIRLSVVLTTVLAVALIVRAVLADPQWTVLLSNLFGAAAVILLGLNRRQQVLRLREKARARELEQRSRIARDLHDVLAHSLGGLVVQLDAADAELESGHLQDAAARLRSSRQLAVEGLREARVAVEQLRSGSESPLRTAADVDLVAELQSVLHGAVGLQLGVELELVGEERLVPASVSESLTAVAREALTNINKHAPAARVSASILFTTDRVRLEVVNSLPPSESRLGELAGTGGGLGLIGLRDRVEAAGGRFHAGPEGRRWVLTSEFALPKAGGPPSRGRSR